MYKILESFNAVANEGRFKDLHTELEELEPEIMRLKTAYMDKGMEPEEAQDMACEKLGCDPEMFDEYLTMKFDELDEAEVDENAFNQAAAAAARAGKKEFEFGGKTHKTTMDKTTAHKLDDDVQTEGRLKDQMIGDSEKMTKKEFAKKYGKEAAEEMFDESVNEAEGTIVFHAEDGGIGITVGGKPVGWAGHPKELAKKLSSMGVDKDTPMFHSSDVDFASEEGFDSDDGAHDMIDSALEMMGLSESNCKRMEESNNKDEGEYDREGEMADNQLNTVHDAAQELQDIIDADDNLPEWVQSKITKAMDYLDTARDYMKSKEDDHEELDAPAGDASVDEARDTHCSDKCCGSDTKAEDCTCPPDCKHCNCNAKMDETTTAGSVAPSTDAKPSGNFGKSVYENAFAEKLNESMNVNYSSSTEGGDSMTVTATDEHVSALAAMLKNAGMGSPSYSKVEVDDEVEEVDEELANAPNEKVQSTDFMQNTIAGGINGPKVQVNPNNPGDNPMAMKNLGKSGSGQVNLGEQTSKLWDLYKEFK